eukprot:13893417-Alexandrium_andersonii.AAC.1
MCSHAAIADPSHAFRANCRAPPNCNARTEMPEPLPAQHAERNCAFDKTFGSGHSVAITMLGRC